MKFLTKKIENSLMTSEQFDELPQEAKKFQCKFFSIVSDHRWYIAAYDPEYDAFYGYVTNAGIKEWGSTSRAELQSLFNRKMVERDLYFDPTPIEDITSGRRF